MEENKIKMPHNVVMEDRRKIALTGVSDVDSFDEETVIVFTDMGELIIKGNNLHVNRLDIDTGEVSVDGKIFSLSYTDDRPVQGGFFSRMFR